MTDSNSVNTDRRNLLSTLGVAAAAGVVASATTSSA